MEIVNNLIARFWPTGALFLTGLILIIYIALGFVYLQQGPKQRELEGNINQISTIVAKELPSVAKLTAEYEECNRSLAPMTDTEAITMLVSIAKQSGIDVSEDSDRFLVPSAQFNQGEVGGGTYQLISFRNIRVQGDHDNVMAFISILDSGEVLETVVLKKVTIMEEDVWYKGEEGDRRAEFRSVSSAVIEMMIDNKLYSITNPISFIDGVATNLMGNDPDTEGTVEGFPNITTTAEEKGYTGNVTPRDGYVLYGHDKILTDNTTQYETVNYLTTLNTKYYYTCEANGRVRQWDGPDIATAREYLRSTESSIELKAVIDVDIYTKP